MANRAQDPRDTYRWQQIRKVILSSNPPCSYCGEPAACVDHRIPIARGGDPFDPANLTPACRPCNLARRYEPTTPAADGAVTITHGIWGVD